MLHCLAYPDAPGDRHIDSATLGAALELAEYFRVSAFRVLPHFGQHGQASTGSLVARVAAILDTAGGAWIARSAIRDALHRNVKADDIAEALTRLEEQERAEQRMVADTGGRPREEWRSLINAETRERGNAESPSGADDEELEWTA